MTFESALAVMPIDSQDRVTRLFDLIRASSNDIRHSFSQAVADEALAIETEMLLLATQPMHGGTQ